MKVIQACLQVILLAVLSLDVSYCQTRIKTDITAHVSLTPYNMDEALHICGNNDAYLPVVNSEAKRIWYRTMKTTITDMLSMASSLHYNFWTNATSADGSTFFFDDPPQCTELPTTSSMWIDKTFSSLERGAMFEEIVTTTTSLSMTSGLTTTTTRTYGLVPTVQLSTSHFVLCEREVGPCTFTKMPPGQCDGGVDSYVTYSGIYTADACMEVCRNEYTTGGMECWGFLYSASVDKCRVLFTENPARLSFHEGPGTCSSNYVSDTEYHVKHCYTVHVNDDTQTTTGSSLTRACASPGVVKVVNSSSFAALSSSQAPSTTSSASSALSSAPSSSTSSTSLTTASSAPSSSTSSTSLTTTSSAPSSTSSTSLTTASSAPPSSSTSSTSLTTTSSASPVSSSSSTQRSVPSTIPSSTSITAPEPIFLRACLCYTKTNNLTQEEILVEIIANLTIDSSKTSATIRTKTTAVDERTSSTTIGVIGVIALLFPGCLIVYLDVLTMCYKLPSKLVKPKS